MIFRPNESSIYINYFFLERITKFSEEFIFYIEIIVNHASMPTRHDQR